MKRPMRFLLVPVLMGCWLIASAQDGREPRPQILRMPEVPRIGSTPPGEGTVKTTISARLLQQHAESLVVLSQAVLADIGTVNKGILPKDIDKRLKQIEKLSRQLRRELSQ